MSKFFKLIAIISISLINISCSNAKDKLAMSQPPAKPEVKQVKAEPEKEVAELTVGANISKEIAEITVKTLNGQTKKLKDIMGADKTLFAVVKPGCIFCESLLAVINSMQPKIKPKFVVVMDGAHGSLDDLKKKASANKTVNAEWIFDENNAFHDKLGAKSFPRLLVIDSKGIVIENQIGLVIPKDKDDLEGKPMPEVLQKLSLTTIDWMKGL